MRIYSARPASVQPMTVQFAYIGQGTVRVNLGCLNNYIRPDDLAQNLTFVQSLDLLTKRVVRLHSTEILIRSGSIEFNFFFKVDRLPNSQFRQIYYVIGILKRIELRSSNYLHSCDQGYDTMDPARFLSFSINSILGLDQPPQGKLY